MGDNQQQQPPPYSPLPSTTTATSSQSPSNIINNSTIADNHHLPTPSSTQTTHQQRHTRNNTNQTNDERTRLIIRSNNNHNTSNNYNSFRSASILTLNLGLYLNSLITFILGLSITYPNSFIINHPNSFSLPISYSILSILTFDLLIFITRSSPTEHDQRAIIRSADSTLSSVSILTVLQLSSFLINPRLNDLNHSYLILITGSILVLTGVFGSYVLRRLLLLSSNNPNRSPARYRYHNPASIFISIDSDDRSRLITEFYPESNHLRSYHRPRTNRFQRLRLRLIPIYGALLTLFSVLLLYQVLWLNLDSIRFDPELYSIRVPTSSSSRNSNKHQLGSITTKVQLSCEWLNEPGSAQSSQSTNEVRKLELEQERNFTLHSSEIPPIITQTIINFSPSRFTSYRSTRWIEDAFRNSREDSYGSILKGIRLCQFDRPGYNSSDNLSINQISSSSILLEKALEVSGEFDRLMKNFNGIGSSGFVLIGHGYGALEARLFASRNPQWVNSVIYIDPESKDRFFSNQKFDLNSIKSVLTWSSSNIYETFLTTLNYSVQRAMVSIFFPEFFFPECFKDEVGGGNNEDEADGGRWEVGRKFCRWIREDPMRPKMKRSIIQEEFMRRSVISKVELEDCEFSYPKNVRTRKILSKAFKEGSSNYESVGNSHRDFEREQEEAEETKGDEYVGFKSYGNGNGNGAEICIEFESLKCGQVLKEVLGLSSLT